MHVINTGSVKDLKSLQSVGEKRAQLIHKWREMFGAYEKVRKNGTENICRKITACNYYFAIESEAAFVPGSEKCHHHH